MPARLFVSPESLRAGAQIVLGAEDSHYLHRVLRLGAGDRIELFDGEGREVAARVTGVREGRIECELEGEVRAPGTRAAVPAAAPLWLVMALAKGEKMELVVQKATELGVQAISVAATARSVPRLAADRGDRRRARWERIAREASRQSGRADVPRIDAVRPLEEVARAIPEGALRLVLHESGPGRVPLAEALGGRRSLAGATAPAGVALVVGPEGGLTAQEVESLRGRGWTICSLGPRILRCETAAIAALAIIGSACGDLAARPPAASD